MDHVLPVIDLQNGCVVRGIAGERDKYRPVESQLTSDPSPASVAKAFRDLNFEDVYVADLGAIAGQPPAWHDYRAIHNEDLRTWVDAGTGDLQHALALADWSEANAGIDSIHRLVVGLENLTDVRELEKIAGDVDPARLVFSLDLKHGKPLCAAEAWCSATPLEIAQDVINLGIHRLIVLDLARVGVGQGTGTEDLCQRIKLHCPGVELIGGGGVSCREDVDHLIATGLSRVLVASALHDGRIS